MSRSIEQLVNQQILRWSEEQRAARRATNPTKETPRPVICISRQFGALGGEVGKVVARQLGFSFYAQELVDEIAKQAHVRRKIVESLDERLRTGISDWIAEKMDGGTFAPGDYTRNLSQVVLTLGRHGQSVIIGRGAHVILDTAYTLRVRCVAPFDWRVAQIVRRDRLSFAEARARVLRVDEERRAFYQQHFKIDITEPTQFDLLMNTATLGERECADLIVQSFFDRFGESSSAPQSRVQNAQPSAVTESPAKTARGA